MFGYTIHDTVLLFIAMFSLPTVSWIFWEVVKRDRAAKRRRRVNIALLKRVDAALRRLTAWETDPQGPRPTAMDRPRLEALRRRLLRNMANLEAGPARRF